MLRLAQAYFNRTTSRFDNMQQWLNLRQDKEEPLSSWMERKGLLAKIIDIDTISGDEWVIHRIHMNLNQQKLKEIKSYLDPGIKFEKVSVRQIINTTMDMESNLKDSRFSRSNKVGLGDQGGGTKM